MINTAKNTICVIICILAVLVLGGCFSQWKGEDANLTIYLGGGAGRASYPPEDDIKAQISYIVDLSGPSTFSVGPTEPGAASISVSLYPGRWTVTVTGFLDGKEYVRGSANVEARAGQSASVNITLGFVGDKTITIAAIEGVIAPVVGAIPVTAITGNAQYTGTIEWSPAVLDNLFAHNENYTAIITLIAKPGYTLEGVKKNFFTVDGVILVSNDTNSGVVRAEFPTTAGTDNNPAPINIFNIGGVTIPVAGATPVREIPETSQYTGDVSWKPPVNEKFDTNTAYTATIYLTAETGFTLREVTPNVFKVAGASTSNTAGSGVITAEFPATAATVSSIITGVTIPVTGATPVTEIKNDEYTGSVAWSPDVLDGKFAALTKYTATITLTPKDGYTLYGVEDDYFMVDWAKPVTNAANSGDITAVFSETGPVTFDSFDKFSTWLGSQETNNITEPYIVKLNLSSITDSFRSTLTTTVNKDKYVYLDLSDSPVETIPTNAFSTTTQKCGTLIGITLPDTLITIGESAFDYCTNLASVTIGIKVTDIKPYAFGGCAKLTNITIPASVTSIGLAAFNSCTNLADVTFQGTIASTGFNGFDGDLRAKYLAAETGGIGTYKTTAPVSSSSVWTKQ